MGVVVITPPAVLVDLDTAKAHLRLEVGEVGDDDALVVAYIAAACAHIDGPGGWLGRAIAPQTLELHADTFGPCGVTEIPYPPLIDVVSVTYLDTEGVLQTADPATYQVTGAASLRPVFGATWPSVQAYPDAVRIRYRAGYVVDLQAEELAAGVPPPIVAAVLLMVGDLYENRETAAPGVASAIPMSTTVERLLSPYRVWNL